MIEISFPDKSVRSYEKGVTPLDIAQSISEGLARNVMQALMVILLKLARQLWRMVLLNFIHGTTKKEKLLFGTPLLTY